jgi:hypothetical protein
VVNITTLGLEIVVRFSNPAQRWGRCSPLHIDDTQVAFTEARTQQQQHQCSYHPSSEVWLMSLEQMVYMVGAWQSMEGDTCSWSGSPLGLYTVLLIPEFRPVIKVRQVVFTGTLSVLRASEKIRWENVKRTNGSTVKFNHYQNYQPTPCFGNLVHSEALPSHPS